MLLFSTMLDIKDTMTETDFIRLLIDENQTNPYEWNRIPEEKIRWDGENTDNAFGDDDLSLQTVKYRNGNIMAARFEKKEPNGQYWRTDYVWNMDDRKMSVRLSRVYSENAAARGKRFSPPYFIKFLISEGFLESDEGLPVLEEPVMIAEDNIDLLADAVSGAVPYHYPIVYVSKNFDDNDDPLDTEFLAKRLRGVAHLFVEEDSRLAVMIASQSEDKHTFDGAVTVYYPKDTFEMRTVNRRHEQERDPDEFVNTVLDLVLDYTNSRELPPLYTWGSVNRRIAYDRLSHKIEERDQAVRDASEANELVESTDDEINEMRGLIKYLQDDLDEKENRISELTGLNILMKNRYSNLEETIREYEKEIPILNDYGCMEEWINTYFPGKLVLHARAKKALKDAAFEDVELVYKSLKLLGTTYWKMKNGGEVSRKDFEMKCAELGLEESPSISDTGAGEHGDTYFVDYHGKRRKLDRHLKKGDIRDGRLCLRIYFFWDDMESTVVIGSLPRHLDTRSS